MADISGNLPRAMTDFFGHIARRVADRSKSFFNLHAAWNETTGKSKHKNDFNCRIEHHSQTSRRSQLGNRVYHYWEFIEEHDTPLSSHRNPHRLNSERLLFPFYGSPKHLVALSQSIFRMTSSPRDFHASTLFVDSGKRDSAWG